MAIGSGLMAQGIPNDVTCIMYWNTCYQHARVDNQTCVLVI
ncbi:hypothetical protein HanXRQr2_Chr09g0375741 [Helianthus annuus]|uniref:Uncharacterized protein n=1 Tax=Helianthus annuus TaxID=4232 RepID=A0A9K3I3Z2_HELAN|nr:hypothetical protein HanXRQr2_Chr09g0375741 [Helianthus annuus]